MNIIYHRNCLDGAFSSFIIELLGRITSKEELQKFIETMVEKKKKGGTNLRDDIEQGKKGKEEIQEGGWIEVNEDFFHSGTGLQVTAFSFFASEFFPLQFPNQKKVLFIVDTNLGSADNIENICKTHELVVVIDHHTSFLDVQKDLAKRQIKNLLYLFDESRCAAQLALDLANCYFSFSSKLSSKFLKDLFTEISYVSANDLKSNETRESKWFVLGWYYFGIEMSHQNPNLYKRIGLLNLEYLLEKGKNQYKSHLQEIQKEVSFGKVCQFVSGALKSMKCFYLQPRNPNKISDIGTVLAYLSADAGLLNLAVLAMKKEYQVRVSCRSSKHKKDPQALVLAKMYGGGGHTEAAGFKMTPHQLRTQFKILSAASVPTNFKLSLAELQQIFLGKFIQEEVCDAEEV